MKCKPHGTRVVLDMSELKRQRMAKGWTQGDVAARMKVTTATYCLWERGDRQPHPKQIPKLAKLFRVPPLDLTHMIEPEEMAAAK